MIIREATAADHARLVEMAAHFIDTTLYRTFITVNLEALGYFCDELLVTGRIAVAEVDGTLVGMLAWEANPHILFGELVEEVVWWVEPEHRRGSIGPRLLHYMEDWCRAHHIPVVKMVAPADAKTGQFYSHSGYRPVETAWLKVLAHEHLQEPTNNQPDIGAATRPASGL